MRKQSIPDRFSPPMRPWYEARSSYSPTGNLTSVGVASEKNRIQHPKMYDLQLIYCNHSKLRPPLKYAFLNEVIAKGLTYKLLCMLTRKPNITENYMEIICCYYISRWTGKKKDSMQLFHMYNYRAKIFVWSIITVKTTPILLFEEPHSLPMGVGK